MFQKSESIPFKVGKFVLTIMLCISLMFTLSIRPARADNPQQIPSPDEIARCEGIRGSKECYYICEKPPLQCATETPAGIAVCTVLGIIPYTPLSVTASVICGVSGGINAAGLSKCQEYCSCLCVPIDCKGQC